MFFFLFIHGFANGQPSLYISIVEKCKQKKKAQILMWTALSS